MAMDFGRRIFSFSECVEFTAGRNTTWRQWERLKQWGYVANTRGGIGVRLTTKGLRELKKRGK
jgi:hypothetical protein